MIFIERQIVSSDWETREGSMWICAAEFSRRAQIPSRTIRVLLGHGTGFYSVAESRGPFSHWLAFVVNCQTTEAASTLTPFG